MRDIIQEVIGGISDEALLLGVKKEGYINRLSKAADMLSLDASQKELVEHICKCQPDAHE